MKNLTLVALLSFCFIHIGFTKENKTSRFEQLELFNKVLYLIEHQYYREIDTQKLIEGALNGMLETLDPHSSFLNKDYFKKMQDDTDGEFGGVGIQITSKDGVIYVVTPIEDTPAFKAGIRARDKIVEINHESVLGINLDQTIERMQGKAGTKLHLGVVREGEKGIKHFNLMREQIKVNPVKSYLVSDDIAVIRLTQFQRKASDSVEKALVDLEKKAKTKNGQGLKGIILDLRGNPGGLLDQAVDVSSLFLKDGVVVTTESRDPNNKDIRYVKKTGYKELEKPLMVLVNGSSASASEIVAGALQDHKRALILGTQTFGKGSVQSVMPLDNKNEYGIKLTIAQYMTPNNRKIQAIGITPDIELDDYDGAWLEENKVEYNFIRESDLRGHLTSTIETEEEKKMRERLEKDVRKQKSVRRQDKAKRKVEEDVFRAYNPKDDYQVNQAIKLIRSMKFFSQIHTKNV